MSQVVPGSPCWDKKNEDTKGGTVGLKDPDVTFHGLGQDTPPVQDAFNKIYTGGALIAQESGKTSTPSNCPIAGKTLPGDAVNQPLDLEDLGNAQNQLMSWCDAGHQLDPSAGGNGQTAVVNQTGAALCNLSQSPINCTSADVQALFAAIPCGSSSAPTMGRYVCASSTISSACLRENMLNDPFPQSRLHLLYPVCDVCAGPVRGQLYRRQTNGY